MMGGYYKGKAKMQVKSHGFNLIEMTIVLVLIALVSAGVITATHLVHNAELKNVVVELQTYQSAIETFKEKYRLYPGDYDQASSYWSGVSDGDADWIIETDLGERIYAWQHLEKAQLITGTYTGSDAGTPDFAIHVNVPGSTIKKGHYFVGTNASGSEIFDRIGTFLQFASNSSDTDPYGPILELKDAYNIDAKLDDGVANTGDMFAVDGEGVTDGDCSDDGDDSGADFDLSKSGTNCRLVWWLY